MRLREKIYNEVKACGIDNERIDQRHKYIYTKYYEKSIARSEN